MSRFASDLDHRIDDRLDRDAEREPTKFRSAQYECARGYHAELKADDARWSQLRVLGIQQVIGHGSKPGYSLELVNCPGCGTTLARKLGASVAKPEAA